ncbi:DUF2726 domain-containing protein [uncultured Rhodoblastus sp.]|uniref:DUF2726 domain-containing protein n=1 Tax=uncultured Rhodoblastus sp. TaxID=543037 RepID=UPI0025F280B9|nr:DUF2726 domain-containing protein [uncultured Rhodoblastus sp.]
MNLDDYNWLELLILVGLILCLALMGRGFRDARYCRGRFLSKNEKEFLRKLDRIVGARYRVFVQVRLADLVDVETGASNRSRWKAISRVFAKSVDFVLCNRSTLDPVLILELDDRSHQAADRRRRDQLVDRVCAEAGLPLVHLKARWSYSEGELIKTLRGAGLSLALSNSMEDL